VNLLVAVFVPRSDRRVVAAYVALAGFAGALVAAALLFDQSPTGHGVIAGAIQRDRLGAFTSMIIAGSGILAIGTPTASGCPTTTSPSTTRCLPGPARG
jgi:hypothetical protein